MKYKSLKIGSKEYKTDQLIESVLESKDIYWLNDCEFENAVIEINRGKVTWKDGDFYNGIWYGDIWESGEWFYGIWTDGVFKGGKFYNGIWENGVFEKGKFINGEVLNGTFKNHNSAEEK